MSTHQVHNAMTLSRRWLHELLDRGVGFCGGGGEPRGGGARRARAQDVPAAGAAPIARRARPLACRAVRLSTAPSPLLILGHGIYIEITTPNTEIRTLNI